MELEKCPWRYCSILGGGDGVKEEDGTNTTAMMHHPRRKVTIREAIGERRYRVYRYTWCWS